MTNFPQFGQARHGDFLLAEGVDHLNHGGYGATPLVVLEAAREWRQRMEADPSTFFRRISSLEYGKRRSESPLF